MPFPTPASGMVNIMIAITGIRSCQPFPRLSWVRVPSLRQHYPASSVLRTHPPSAAAGAGPHGFAIGGEVPSPCHDRRLPLLRTIHVPCVLPSLPRRDRRLRVSLASPTTAAFPVQAAGRLPHCVFRGLLDVYSRCGPHGPLTLYRAFSRSASGHLSPPDPPRVLPAGARVCRPGFPPGRTVHLGKAHARSNETPRVVA